MRIEWSPIKLNPDLPISDQITTIWESVKEEQAAQDKYYGDVSESMDKLEQQFRETFLPYLTTYSNKYGKISNPITTYHFSKYLAGTFIIVRDE